MDEETIMHGLKDLGIEIIDLHTRINAMEKKLEKCKALTHVCVCNECECNENIRDLI